MAKSKKSKPSAKRGSTFRDRRIGRDLLSILGPAYQGFQSPIGCARIVTCYVNLEEFTLPRWRDLDALDQMHLISETGHMFGIDHTLTFNVSDKQRLDWTSIFGNITEGFRREVLYPTRDLFNGDMTYWFYVEPKISKGKEAATYQDGPGFMRRFDVHMALAFQVEGDSAPDTPALDRFQRRVWNRTEKLTPAPKRQSYPLFKLFRQARMSRVRNIGWAHYSSKYAHKVVDQHGDVVGNKPWGSSRNIRQAAKALYCEIRQLVHSKDLSPAYLDEARTRKATGKDSRTCAALLAGKYYSDALCGPQVNPFESKYSKLSHPAQKTI